MRDFVEHRFEHVGLDWEEHVRFDERYLRPTEVDALIGDPSKAAEPCWAGTRARPPELARLMVDAEPSPSGRRCPCPPPDLHCLITRPTRNERNPE